MEIDVKVTEEKNTPDIQIEVVEDGETLYTYIVREGDLHCIKDNCLEAINWLNSEEPDIPQAISYIEETIAIVDSYILKDNEEEWSTTPP